jgi:hypothetical protein
MVLWHPDQIAAFQGDGFANAVFRGTAMPYSLDPLAVDLPINRL